MQLWKTNPDASLDEPAEYFETIPTPQDPIVTRTRFEDENGNLCFAARASRVRVARLDKDGLPESEVIRILKHMTVRWAGN